MRDSGIFSIVAIVLGAVFLPMLILWPITSSLEAKTYSKLTGVEVTTWEAMWVELRVDCRQ